MARAWAVAIVCLALLVAPTVALKAADDVTALPGVAPDPDLAAKLPAAARAAGVLKIATTAYTPPITYFGPDNKEIIGINADMAQAFGIMFGTRIEMTDLGVAAALVPAIKSRRFDMSISGVNDTPELEQQVDVIDYMYDGKTIMVQRGNPLKIATMNDLCGKKVSVAVGTLQEQMVQAQSKKCAMPIDIMSIPKQPDVLVAVRAGRVDATVNGYATSVYTTRHQIQNGVGLEALPEVRLAVGYLGMLTQKDNTALRDATAAALQKLIDSGAYGAIMKKWGLEQLAIKAAKINDAASMPIDY
jgi:polar amino acid transport system substrate-binding protein